MLTPWTLPTITLLLLHIATSLAFALTPPLPQPLTSLILPSTSSPLLLNTSLSFSQGFLRGASQPWPSPPRRFPIPNTKDGHLLLIALDTSTYYLPPAANTTLLGLIQELGISLSGLPERSYIVHPRRVWDSYATEGVSEYNRMVTLELHPVVSEEKGLRKELGLVALKVFGDLVGRYGGMSGRVDIWEVENARGGFGVYIDEIGNDA